MIFLLSLTKQYVLLGLVSCLPPFTNPVLLLQHFLVTVPGLANKKKNFSELVRQTQGTYLVDMHKINENFRNDSTCDLLTTMVLLIKLMPIIT